LLTPGTRLVDPHNFRTEIGEQHGEARSRPDPAEFNGDEAASSLQPDS
jgi:hypothetical protein